MKTFGVRWEATAPHRFGCSIVVEAPPSRVIRRSLRSIQSGVDATLCHRSPRPGQLQQTIAMAKQQLINHVRASDERIRVKEHAEARTPDSRLAAGFMSTIP